MSYQPLWYKYKYGRPTVPHEQLQAGKTYFGIFVDTTTGYITLDKNNMKKKNPGDKFYEVDNSFHTGGKKYRRNKSRRNKKTRKNRRKTIRRR